MKFMRKVHLVLIRNQLNKRKLNSFKVVICDVDPKFIISEKYKKTFFNRNQIMIKLTHGIWIKNPNKYL